jgi:2-amino-4-hydroxy-6-hydroxymethyldihydropteridine diphosphokinase
LEPKAQTYLIALGGNMPSALGGPEVTLRAALARLPETGLTLEAVSRFFQTPCFPVGAGPDYVNAAARLSSDKSPAEVLQILHQIEAEFGRERIQRWGMRSLDLDILAAGQTVLPDQQTHDHWQTLGAEAQRTTAPTELILPHPRLSERAFVLVPLADIAPDWAHPVLRRTVREMLAALPAKEKDSVLPC